VNGTATFGSNEACLTTQKLEDLLLRYGIRNLSRG
jgi:hypothetical protein